MSKLWQDKAAEKRASLSARIPIPWRLPTAITTNAQYRRDITGFIESILDADTLSITSLNTPELLARMRAKTLSAQRTMFAFCKRAAFAHQLNACFIEILFAPALLKAKELDAYHRANGRTIGPLHGLPVTLSDQFHVEGAETTMGYIGWMGIPRPTESELVRELKQLGAVIIGKTTPAQGLRSGETSNNIMGYNFNPVSQDLSSGGSSGGEGAIQALRGSAVGFGADSGGSVTIPAAFCGVYALKPSTGRISYRNAVTPVPGQAIIPATIGIMGPSLDSIELTFKALLSTEPWLRDPEVVKMPWGSHHDTPTTEAEGDDRALSFGILKSNGIMRAHPPIERALRIVAEALRASNHEVLEWARGSHAEAANLHRKVMSSDGFSDVHAQLALGHEPPIDECILEIGPSPSAPISVAEFFDLTQRLEQYRCETADNWASTAKLTKTGRAVDAVILPVAPHAAVIPGRYYGYSSSCIMIARDYCCVVVPVTVADKSVDVKEDGYVPLGELDKRNWEAYDAEAYNGAPAGVQIVCQRHCEEKLLRMAAVLDEALKKHGRAGN